MAHVHDLGDLWIGVNRWINAAACVACVGGQLWRSGCWLDDDDDDDYGAPKWPVRPETGNQGYIGLLETKQ